MSQTNHTPTDNDAQTRPGMAENTNTPLANGQPTGQKGQALGQNDAYMKAIKAARAASDEHYIDDFGEEYVDDGSDNSDEEGGEGHDSQNSDARRESRVRSEASTDDLVRLAIHGLFEKKGKNIVSLDLRELTDTVTDAFVVVHGDSTTQVRALAGSVEDEIEKATGERPWHVEGLHNATWVVLDYVSVVVHVFLEETRDFYGIEELWNDAIVQEHFDEGR